MDGEFFTVHLDPSDLMALEVSEIGSLYHNALLVEHYHASVDDTGTAEHAHGTCSSQLFTSVIYSCFFLAYTSLLVSIHTRIYHTYEFTFSEFITI